MKNLVSLILVITCLAPNFAQGQLERNNGSPQDNQNEPKKDKPNLIMVLVDEHSFRTLGCYRELLPYDQAYIWGDGIAVETPNIDALAHEGALYKNFYTVAPRKSYEAFSLKNKLFSILLVSHHHYFYPLFLSLHTIESKFLHRLIPTRYWGYKKSRAPQ